MIRIGNPNSPFTFSFRSFQSIRAPPARRRGKFS